MHSIPGTVATAAGAFAGTNVDAFVLLTVLFAAARASGASVWRVVVAQCIVFVTVVVASAAAATALTFIALRWVGLLGVVPLALGIHGLVTARRKDEHDPRVTDGVTAIVTLMLSVCADNLSVYIVLFRAGSVADFAVTVGVFALLQVVWVVVAYTVATRKTVVVAMRRTRIWLVPTIFVAIGLAIIVRTGVFS